MALTVNIDKYINESAAVACKIEDKETRIRTYALNIAADAAVEALNKLGINADTKNSLFKISSFAKSFELADIYVNGCRLDVRITFDGAVFTIPKTHEKYDAVPCAYLVIKLDKKNKQAELLGYLDTSKTEYNRTDTPYYAFSTGILSPVSTLADFIKSLKPSNKPCSVDELEKIKELCAAFIDDEISESEKVFFIKHVIACPDCRNAFCITAGFDAIMSQIKNYHELLNDSTLSVLSGNQKEVDEALLANMSLVENAQEDEGERQTEEAEEEPLSLIEESEENENLILEEPLTLQTEEDIEDIKEEQQQESESDMPELLPDSEEPLLLEEDSEEELLLNPDSEDTLAHEESAAENLLLPDEKTPEEDMSDNLLIQETEPEPLEETPDLAEIKPDEEADVLKLEEDENLLEDNIPELNLEPEKADEAEKSNTESLTEEEPLENLVDNDDNLLVFADEKDNDLSSSDEILTKNEEEATLDNIQPDGDLPELSADESLILEENIESVEPEQIFEEKNESKQPEEISLNAESEEDTVSPLEFEDLDTLDALDEPLELKDESSEDNQFETTGEEGINFNIDNKAEDNNLSSYAPQEPVELNYDDADTGEALHVDSGFDFDKEINKENDSQPDTEEDAYHKAFDVVEKHPEDENSEIQNLLDDNLMALLADNDDSDSANNAAVNAENNYEDTVSQQNYEESSKNQHDDESEEHPDETINSLFENNENPQPQNSENQTFELAQEPVSAETVKRTKKLAILAGLLVVMVAAGGTTLVFNHQKALQNKAQDTANQGDELFDFQNNGSDEDTDTAAVPQDINKSMTNSFSDKPAAITITKLSWQVSEKLAADASVKEYLQTAGKNIQMNLQNDLANSADIAFNNSVKVSFEIAPDNTMKGMQVLESSGSDKIDEIILRSIKNTLKYISVPKLKDYKSDYFLTLIINF